MERYKNKFTIKLTTTNKICSILPNTLAHGLYLKFFPGGNTRIKCTYDNGLKHGLYLKFYLNGQLKINCTYKKGGAHGLFQWNITE